MQTNRYSDMTSAELQREQERLSAEIEANMRRLKVAGIVFFVAVWVMALAATITMLGAMHIIH